MVIEILTNLIQGVINSVPEPYKELFILFLYTLFIVLYSLFIWRFYIFLSSRDLINLNLAQYNYSKHPVLEKFFVAILYSIEYLIILPFLVLFWFAILSIFLFLLSNAGSVNQILIISAAIITATRITSYISEDLSKDLAKILPFTLLGLFIINEDFFDFGRLIERILQVSGLFNQIFMFIIFIFATEFLLRIIYLIAEFFISEEERKEE